MINSIIKDFTHLHREDVLEKSTRNGIDKYYSINTPDGWKALDSPYRPRDEARKILGELQGENLNLVLLGCGSGFLLDELAELSLSELMIICSNQKSVEIIQEKIAEENILASTEITLIASNNSLETWENHLKPFLEKYPDHIIKEHPREIAAFGSFYNRIRLQIEQLKLPAYPEVFIPAHKILFFRSGGLLENEIIEELNMMNIQVIQCDSLCGHSLNPQEAFKLLHDTKPDCVLSCNNQGSDKMALFPQVCEIEGVPWMTWMLDDPRFVLNSMEQNAVTSSRYGFCWDKKGVDEWKNLNIGPAHALPLATNPRLFYPGEGDPYLKDRLVFVGTPLFQSTKGYFAALDEDKSARLIAEYFQKFVIQTRITPDKKQLDEAFRELKLEGIFSGERLRRLPAFITQQANQYYRLQTLLAISELDPIVYGEGWENLLPTNVDLRGPVDYYRELPGIYCSQAIHLSLTNLQMHTYPNQRVFDVGASGGLVICDKVKGWSELFGHELDELVFYDFDQLKSTYQYLRDNQAKREELRQKLRDIVLARHTIGHRIQKMLSVLPEYIS